MFRIIILSCILATVSFAVPKSPNATQPAYALCAELSDGSLKLRCLKEVREATRRFPEELVEIARQLKEEEYRVRLLIEARDRVFTEGVLAVCEGFASDDDMGTLVKCIEDAGEVNTKYKESQSPHWLTGRYYNWPFFDALEKKLFNKLSSACQNWQHYAFADPHWRRSCCWRTIYTQPYTDYTLGTRRERTRRGLEYDAFVIVPVERVSSYYLYHCEECEVYCWSRVKDFSEVTDH